MVTKCYHEVPSHRDSLNEVLSIVSTELKCIKVVGKGRGVVRVWFPKGSKYNRPLYILMAFTIHSLIHTYINL